jgi:hypothetical protein
MKYTHQLADHNKVTQLEFKRCFHFERHNQKTDTTAQPYCTLSTYVTPKTISCQNQKTNTTPQLYCTLSTWYVKPKPISCQNQKLTQQHNWNKVPPPPAHAQRVYSFLCP